MLFSIHSHSFLNRVEDALAVINGGLLSKKEKLSYIEFLIRGLITACSSAARSSLFERFLVDRLIFKEAFKNYIEPWTILATFLSILELFPAFKYLLILDRLK
jgi:hypothetical protein